MTGEKIKQLRKFKGLTIEQMATALEVTPRVIDNIEKNNHSFLKHVPRIADFYNVRESDIISLMINDKVSFLQTEKNISDSALIYIIQKNT